MKVTRLFILSLLVLCHLLAMASQVVGQKPEAGKTYYLYNVDKKEYVGFDSNGKITLNGQGTALTLSKTDTSNSESFFMATATGEKVSTSFLGDVGIGESGSYDHWILKAVDGGGNDLRYSIGCRIPDSGAVFYIYWSNLFDKVVKLPFEPASSFTKGQWILVAQSYHEDNVVTLDEASTEYTKLQLQDGTSATVRLKRTFTLNAWNSLCLPFGVEETGIISQFGKDAKVAEFTGATATTLQFTTVSRIEAGKSYLVYPTQAALEGKDYYEFFNVRQFADVPSPVVRAPITYQGSFVKTTAPKGAYVLRKNEVYHLQSDMAMKGFRACFVQDESSEAKISVWTLDGKQATGIGHVEGDIGVKYDVYNVNGQMVRKDATTLNGLDNGVYIVNGKKIIIK